MHRLYLAIPLLALAIAGCHKDNIVDIDPSDTTATADNEAALEDISFDRNVSIAFSTTADATVSGTGGDVSATVDGNAVTIRNTGSEKVYYTLTGSTDNGCLKVYSEKKMAIELNGVSIANPHGAAINIQDGTAYIVVSGNNALADGPSYTATPDDEDEKAALFSEDQLIFSGTGTLNVTATGKSGITSDDYLHFMGSPTITVSSTAAHGVRGKDYVLVDGGTLHITVSANMKKGITSDGDVTFRGGTTTINVSGGAAYDDDDSQYTGSAGIMADGCFAIHGGSLDITNSGTGGKGISTDGDATFTGGDVTVATTGSNYGNSGGWGGSSANSVSAKAIKADGNISISGGNISATSKAHEAIEAKGTLAVTAGTVYAYSMGDDAINAGGDLTISGGYVYGHTAGTSTGADGIDANGNIYLNGGLVYAICTHGNPDVALDANSEGGKKLYVQQGATLVAVGGLERGASLTQTCYQASSWTKGAWYSMTVDDNTFCFKTPTGGNSLVVSGTSKPQLKSGVSVTGGTELFQGMLNLDGTPSGGSDVTLSTYSNSGGGPGGW